MKLRFTSIERELLDWGFLRVYHPNQDMALPSSVPTGRSNLAKVRKVIGSSLARCGYSAR